MESERQLRDQVERAQVVASELEARLARPIEELRAELATVVQAHLTDEAELVTRRSALEAQVEQARLDSMRLKLERAESRSRDQVQGSAEALGLVAALVIACWSAVVAGRALEAIVGATVGIGCSLAGITVTAIHLYRLGARLRDANRSDP